MKKAPSKKSARSASDNYAQREFGVTRAELGRFQKRMDQKISKERKRGKIKRFSGNLEKDLADWKYRIDAKNWR